MQAFAVLLIQYSLLIMLHCIVTEWSWAFRFGMYTAKQLAVLATSLSINGVDTLESGTSDLMDLQVCIKCNVSLMGRNSITLCFTSHGNAAKLRLSPRSEI
jgi:hypothetical protein